MLFNHKIQDNIQQKELQIKLVQVEEWNSVASSLLNNNNKGSTDIMTEKDSECDSDATELYELVEE